MKKFIACALALLLGSVGSGMAQVSVEIVMEQDQFLVGEAIPAAVRITNRSGQTLQMGADSNWINFTLEFRGGVVVKNGEVPVQGAFTLESGKVATRRVDLQPYFALNQVGRYRLNASVQIKDWDSTLSTKPKGFDVIKGTRLWAQEFGMLLPPGVTNRPPEVRRYALEQANNLHNQLRLYLRVTNQDGTQVIKVLPVGPMVSISNPEHQIDRVNNLHVLYQLGARTYLYAVFTPEGEFLIRQTHEITTTRPRLQSDDRGNFSVTGGARRPSIDDLPGETDSTAHAPTPTP